MNERSFWVVVAIILCITVYLNASDKDWQRTTLGVTKHFYLFK